MIEGALARLLKGGWQITLSFDYGSEPLEAHELFTGKAVAMPPPTISYLRASIYHPSSRNTERIVYAVPRDSLPITEISPSRFELCIERLLDVMATKAEAGRGDK